MEEKMFALISEIILMPPTMISNFMFYIYIYIYIYII